MNNLLRISLEKKKKIGKNQNRTFTSAMYRIANLRNTYNVMYLPEEQNRHSFSSSFQRLSTASNHHMERLQLKSIREEKKKNMKILAYEKLVTGQKFI